MARKGKGGRSHRKNKKRDEEGRELIFKEDGQEYAQVTKVLGNCRLECFCFDGVTRQCHIRGKMRRRVWVNQGDIVLIGLREYQDAKADVILKYYPHEARKLQMYGELPDTARVTEGGEEDGEVQVTFGIASSVIGGPATTAEEEDLSSSESSSFDEEEI